jgi:prepilin-type N-terminal cleavage/methylation domain-containing protein
MNWKLLNRIWHANLGMASAITLGIIALSCPFIAHKNGGEFGKALMEIHYGKFLTPDYRWIWIDGQGFLLAFLIGSGLLMHRKSVKKAANVAADDPAVPGSSVTLLDFGSGGLTLATEGEKRGLRLFRCPASGLDKLSLAQERWLVLLPSDAGFTTDHLEAVQQLTAKIKPGSAKRLRFAIAPAAGSEPLLDALLATGAQAIPLAEGSDFAPALIAHLCSESEVLKAGLKKAATRPAAKPALAANAGFTLVEMLVSMVIVGLLVSGAASSLERMAQEDRVTSAAREFEALFRDARDLARRENTWVRVALLPADKEREWLLRGQSNAPRMGTTLRVLRRPAQETQAVALHAPTAAFELSGLQESAASLPAVYPQSLQAGWAFVPGQEKWKLWHEQVRVHSELLTASPENSPWLLNPAHASDLPDHLHLTPINKHRSLQTAVIPNDDPVQLANGQSLPAQALWGQHPVTHWTALDGIAPRDEPTPAFDIAPNGSLVGATTQTTLTFTFQRADQGPGNPRRVHIQTATGNSWIE